MEKQILIALDDSVSSNLSLDYVAHLFSADPDVKFLLLNCQPQGAEVMPEPEDPRNSLMPDHTQAKGQQKCTILLGKANRKLTSLGIPEDRITISCQSAANIASGITKHAEQKLVDSIVVAKRGMGLVGELLLGSVSSSLFDICRSTPLWIIDGVIQSKRLLVPVDGSPASLMAVDHLAHVFSQRTDVQFFLFHVKGFLSSPKQCKPENFYDRWGKEWCDKNLSGNDCMFIGPTKLLKNAGIPEKCIETLPQATAIEESTTIINAARKHRCGTIVIGRRKPNEVKGFLGGVSKRTVVQAENLALWVVG
ncbi:universal stress protein [Desulfosediminicola flagellatus]|uniref:universal stress protein n=1 Tax=Desulfosediminicola flagellatus TaxID=2569541 RepID=UPI0010AC0820|nr:universal stress protein [Desulfosediminicola flagellatus]